MNLIHMEKVNWEKDICWTSFHQVRIKILLLMTLFTLAWNNGSSYTRYWREKLIKIAHNKMCVWNIFRGLLHIVVEESREEKIFAALSFLIDFWCNLFSDSVKKREFSFFLESLILTFLIQLKASFDSRVFGYILKNLLRSIKINLTELLIPVRILIKDNLIMRHIIKNFKEHDITKIFSFIVHDIIINDIDLLIFKQIRILIAKLFRNPLTQGGWYFNNSVLYFLEWFLIVIFEVI